MIDETPSKMRSNYIYVMNSTCSKFGIAALLVCVFPIFGYAQNFSIDWSTIDSGGGTSTGGIYSVSGTIGQPDAGSMSGGTYSVAGGFWSLISVVQPFPPGPGLNIRLTGTNTVMVYWASPSTGFSLQMNTAIETTNWTTPAETVQDNGTIKFIIVNPPTGNRFYRLKTP
jgi:hypothetical protein